MSDYENEQAVELDASKADIAEFIDDKQSMMEDCIQNRSTHDSDMQEAYKWRKGQVGKPYPNKPFKNSSDIRIRQSEAEIQLRNAVGVRSVLRAPRLTRFIHCSDSATRLENYMEYLLRGSGEDFGAQCEAELDVLHEQGKVITKQTWECVEETRVKTVDRKTLEAFMQQAVMMALQADPNAPQKIGKLQDKPPTTIIKKVLSEQEIKALIADYFKYDTDEDSHSKRINYVYSQFIGTEDTIEALVDEEVRDMFKVTVIRDTANVVWYPSTISDIQQAEVVWHRYRLNERQLLAKSEKNGGNLKNVDKLIELAEPSASYPQDMQQMKDLRDNYNGINDSRGEKGYFNIVEMHCYAPRNFMRKLNGEMGGDGDAMVKSVITYCPDVSATIVGPLRAIGYPYQLRTSKARWCFTSLGFRQGRGSLYDCEGVVKLLNPFEKAYNIDFNAARDRNDIALSPPILFRDGVGITNEMLSRGWPQKIKINDMAGDLSGHVHQVQYPALANGFQSDAMQIAAEGKKLIGSVNLDPLHRYADSPTGTQVEAERQPSMALSEADIASYHDFKARQYRQLYDLLWENKFEDMDYGEDVEFSLERGQSYKVTKEDFKPDYLILSGADVFRENPQLDAQKRFAFGQFLMSDPNLQPYFSKPELLSVLGVDFLGGIASSRVMLPMDKQQQTQMLFEEVKQAAVKAGEAEVEAKQKAAKREEGMTPQLPMGGQVGLNTGAFMGPLQ